MVAIVAGLILAAVVAIKAMHYYAARGLLKAFLETVSIEDAATHRVLTRWTGRVMSDQEQLLDMATQPSVLTVSDNVTVHSLPEVTVEGNVVTILTGKIETVVMLRNGQIELTVYGPRGGLRAHVTVNQHALLRAMYELGMISKERIVNG